MENYVKNFDDTLNGVLNKYARKPTLVRGVIHLLLMLYVVRLAPTLPQPVMNLFDNAYFKLFIFSMVLWTAQFSPSTSLLIALAFMITVNYANKKPLWEFLENVDVAPSKNDALNATATAVDQQVNSTMVVSSVEQNKDTIVVQPSIVNTPNGPTVVNPTVVVAPAVVATTSGEKVVIQPDVTVVDPPAQSGDSATAKVAQVSPDLAVAVSTGSASPSQSADAVKALAVAAVSPQPAPADVVAPIANVALANVSSNGAQAVKKLAEQAASPAAAPADQVTAVAQKALVEIADATAAKAPVPAVAQASAPQTQANCYPARHINMSKVDAYSNMSQIGPFPLQ